MRNAQGERMSEIDTTPRTKTRPRAKRPRLYKVILLNDDYTPREFVVAVLSVVFRMNEEEALNVMLTAHGKGTCVVAVSPARSPKPRQPRRPNWAGGKATR
jgi:ATP-dependent Clp protease adaptor protein ClpS